mmetsp:Transcript_77622/g.155487  ORF Transcript_77622/g.155487 Transcript_77622/m.155487 type:complete len:206 (+) Transcript_77622:87-704(+)
MRCCFRSKEVNCRIQVDAVDVGAAEKHLGELVVLAALDGEPDLDDHGPKLLLHRDEARARCVRKAMHVHVHLDHAGVPHLPPKQGARLLDQNRLAVEPGGHSREAVILNAVDEAHGLEAASKRRIFGRHPTPFRQELQRVGALRGRPLQLRQGWLRDLEVEHHARARAVAVGKHLLLLARELNVHNEERGDVRVRRVGEVQPFEV